MFKPVITVVSLLLLTACNVAGLATTSYSPDNFQNMNDAKFTGLVQIKEGVPSEGYIAYAGPKITYFWGTDGFISALKKPSGEVTYRFNVALEYQEDYIRRYDTVTDVSGTKLTHKTIRAYEGNGGYVKENITVTLTRQQLDEAKYDGLFVTFAAKEHERKVARSSRGQSLGIMGALALANEVQGGSNPEHKTNDNYDLSVPARYVRNFLREINK